MNALLSLLVLPCFLCASVVNVFSLDREAFTITSYDLQVQLDPDQSRIAVHGKLTLRNVSSSPQKNAVLQISSSLDWRQVQGSGKPLQFVSQLYASDIDHTGALNEAVIVLPTSLAPSATIELQVGYEGTIALDATRLARMGTPQDLAHRSDWDVISKEFTAVRGAGYVVWYPIATDAASLAADEDLFETLSRWNEREAGVNMRLRIDLTNVGMNHPQMFFNGVPCPLMTYEELGSIQRWSADCGDQALRLDAPTLVIADYQVVERPAIEVHYLAGHSVAALGLAEAAENAVPFISEWFGKPRERARVADLAEPNAAPFESGALMLTPLATVSKLAGLVAVHPLTHAAFLSSRPWIEEGLAHFAQALYIEHQTGRRTALDYMARQNATLQEAEKTTTPPKSGDDATRSLVNTTSEVFYRTKAMYVWWMLRDLLGDAALKRVLSAYRPEQDKDPSYVPHLIQAQTQRDLEWFFDDWIYRDRGLPSFRVDSAFPRKTLADTYVVTVTIENTGGAGAEVPVIVHFTGGEVTRRLVVHAKSSAVVRLELPKPPHSVTINDGSVPTISDTNQPFTIEAPGNDKQ